MSDYSYLKLQNDYTWQTPIITYYFFYLQGLNPFVFQSNTQIFVRKIW